MHRLLAARPTLRCLHAVRCRLGVDIPHLRNQKGSFSRQFSEAAGGDMGGGGDGGSITYSGGQASSGQGGFYGAGGARSYGRTQTKHRPEALAHAADIKSLRKLMDEVHELESQLRQAKDMSRQIQIKGAIKKKMTGKDMVELLKRLEMKGEPVWGLDVSERALVKEARKLFRSC